MKNIGQLFHVKTGSKLDFGKMTVDEQGIAFVSRSSRNNGIAGFVEPVENAKKFDNGAITVALGGTYVLSAFVQPVDFYTAQNVAVLVPKSEMTLPQKLYYCHCISMNRYRYSAFGREANRTLKDILVPDISDIPEFVMSAQTLDFSIIEKPLRDIFLSFDIEAWKEFKYDDIFIIKKGYYNKKPDNITKGNIRFLGATERNNGLTQMYSIDDISLFNKIGTMEYDDLEKKIFAGNAIAVTNNGSVGYAYYQDEDFTCSHDVTPLYLKNHTLNKYIAMFLVTIIKVEKFRWSYGRKWRPKRMPDSIIKLPVTKEGVPDYIFMEQYIKSLPYSSAI